MARSYISRVALASFVVCIILHPITINGDTDSTEESTSEELTSEMSATSTVEITGSTEITTASTGTVPTESKGSTAESTFGTTQNSTTGNMTTEAETPTQGGPEDGRWGYAPGTTSPGLTHTPSPWEELHVNYKFRTLIETEKGASASITTCATLITCNVV
ncbi:uncharacterized protein LOC144440627 [Glandiceps talaboti]